MKTFKSLKYLKNQERILKENVKKFFSEVFKIKTERNELNKQSPGNFDFCWKYFNLRLSKYFRTYFLRIRRVLGLFVEAPHVFKCVSSETKALVTIL